MKEFLGFKDKFEYFSKFSAEELFVIIYNVKLEKDKWIQVMNWFELYLKTASNYIRFKQKLRETSDENLQTD